VNRDAVPERTDAVVIGAGALGASTAFHLAKLGLSVALLDKTEFASQTSARAAGLSGQLRSDEAMTRIAARAVRKIENFAAETGEEIVFFQPGSLKIARRPEHEAELRDDVARGQRLGLDVAMISLEDARRLMPYLSTEGVRAVMHMRKDVYLEPAQIPACYRGRADGWVVPCCPIRAWRRLSPRARRSRACKPAGARSARASWSMRPAPGCAWWQRSRDRA
jgi:glycine/D-amino acid oxidase-like deaminating enzyme